MRQALFVFILTVFSIAISAADPATNVVERLTGRAMGNTPLMNDLEELCDRIGGRATGSKACEAAVDWGVRKFKEAGMNDVKTEDFTVPLLWLPISAEVSCTTPRAFTIRAVAAPYSPSTPADGLGKPLVDAGEGTTEDYARLGEKARGAIALIHSKEMHTLEDLFEEYLTNKSILEAAKKAGVSGILRQSSRPRGLLYRHPVTLGNSYSPVPYAVISREQAELLSRLAEKSEVRIRMLLKNQTGGSYQAKNVVAEIRGSEKPDEIVLIGAHLDSWELGTGANDNGINAVTVIDVARAIKQLGLTPRRTIRFVLFTGEEQGMWGSAGYVQRHASEMDQHVAVVVFDIGSGKTTGFYLNGREELRKPVDEILNQVPGFNATHHAIDGVDGTDNFDFLLSGVPNLVANQDATPYLPDYHAESDVFDMVDEREARINDAIASVLVWGLAESPSRLAPRQTRGEVEKVLKDTKLDEQMKAFDQWDDWEAGKRGVSKK
jgi:carboxypeptidase Q